ncbi:hypothetical protein D3C86_1660980 [compost metagenome]
MAGDLRNLPRGQVGVNIFGQLLALAGQPRNLFGNIDSRVVLHKAQFFDFCLELGNRLFKIQEGGFHRNTDLSVKGRILPEKIPVSTARYVDFQALMRRINAVTAC